MTPLNHFASYRIPFKKADEAKIEKCLNDFAREHVAGFFEFLNKWDELGYTKGGLKFYVDEYFKKVNSPDSGAIP